jgi:hypothetical protein
MFNGRIFDSATFRKQGVFHHAVGDYGAWQKTRMAVNRIGRIKEIKRWVWHGKGKVGIIKSANGSNIFPETFKIITEYRMGVDRRGNDFSAEIIIRISLKKVNQHIRFKQINPH